MGLPVPTMAPGPKHPHPVASCRGGRLLSPGGVSPPPFPKTAAWGLGTRAGVVGEAPCPQPAAHIPQQEGPQGPVPMSCPHQMQMPAQLRALSQPDSALPSPGRSWETPDRCPETGVGP